MEYIELSSASKFLLPQICTCINTKIITLVVFMFAFFIVFAWNILNFYIILTCMLLCSCLCLKNLKGVEFKLNVLPT